MHWGLVLRQIRRCRFSAGWASHHKGTSATRSCFEVMRVKDVKCSLCTEVSRKPVKSVIGEQGTPQPSLYSPGLCSPSGTSPEGRVLCLLTFPSIKCLAVVLLRQAPVLWAWACWVAGGMLPLYLPCPRACSSGVAQGWPEIILHSFGDVERHRGGGWWELIAALEP